MKTERLQFDLPPELIAQRPADIRSDSRLLVLNRANAELTDSRFSQIAEFFIPGDCLVLNDTKVLQARFFARRSTGGKLEGLFLTEPEHGQWLVLLKASAKIKKGQHIYLKDKAGRDFCQAVLLDKTIDGTCRLKVETNQNLEAVLERIGFPPLPPYIKRSDDPDQAAVDSHRYQTVFAREPGAVAAPTAGLHFTKELIKQLQAEDMVFAYLTLHVGPATFKPIATENIEQHQIHQEQFSIDAENAGIINAAKQKHRRIVAVGTTTVRALETAAAASVIEPARGELVEPAVGQTELFIKPGYEFKIVDAMVTNFHLPRSTLLALVAAFAGLDNILTAYRHAVEMRYRFYSYGDAMLII
jgi:S-adenosylmethionine:tRNA ribosyltransferase-isomerase